MRRQDRQDNRQHKQANPSQREAILHGGGPCAVIAGPGSGKTYVLVERIRHLIDSGTADPDRILVLTFSKVAASHMRARFLDRQAGRGDGGVVFGTMHAVFYRILQESGHRNLRLISPMEKERYLRRLCALVSDGGGLRGNDPIGGGGREKNPPAGPARGQSLPSAGVTAEELQHLISRCKNGLPCRQKWLPALVEEYDHFLANRDCLDYDDMILLCLRLLRQDPEALARWQDRFQWILVDEFQDVSRLQYEVLTLLAGQRANLFVVGDDDQSIYGFRGADPATMRRFLDQYRPGVRQIGLMINYRCGKKILRASSALIRENRDRIDKRLRSGSASDGSFSLRMFSGRDQQYRFLASLLAGMSPGERAQTAVIFRTHAGARAFLSLLTDMELSFDAEATLRRSSSPKPEETILEDLLAYCRAAEGLTLDGARRQDLQRILNRPERYLSGSFLRADRLGRDDILRHAGPDREAVRDFLEDLMTLSRLAPAWSLRYLLESVGYRGWAETALAGSSQASSDAGRRVHALFGRLSEASGSCADPASWIRLLEQTLAQFREMDAASAAPGSSRGAGGGYSVRVLTMHACKGLEFDTVFVPDLNEGTVPSRRAVSTAQIEEERRLLYVAMTRAKKTLVLTCLEGTPDRPAAPSRFLAPFTRTGGLIIDMRDKIKL